MNNKHLDPTPIDSITHCMVDGKLLLVTEKHLSLFDRGFLLADGVFETVLIKNGVAVWWEEHMARLAAAAKTLGIDMPYRTAASDIDTKKFLADVKTLCHANHAPPDKNYVLRVTLSRGVVYGRGLWPDTLQQKSPNPLPKSLPTIAMALYHHQPMANAAAVAVAMMTRKNHLSPLAAIKWLGGYGDAMLARANINADDALLLNTSGNLVSATVGNVFLLLPDGWQTPAAQDGIIHGLARHHILASGKWQVRAATIPQDNIENALAGFISNSLGVRPIKTIDGRTLLEGNKGVETCTMAARIYDE